MSLAIDSRSITAVYALGQWFEIEPDSFATDSFQLVSWMGYADDVEKYGDDYERDVFDMGAIYHQSEPEPRSRGYENSKATFMNPQGCIGVCFTEKKTKQRVSFSLMEIRAFKEDRALLNK